MVVLEEAPDRLVLGGIPGSRRWMIMATLTGAGITYAVFAFKLPLIPLIVGVIVAQMIFWTGAITLAVGRLRLTLDKGNGSGRYEVRSPIIDAGKPCSFELRHVHSVSLETESLTRPHYEAFLFRARLLLTSPKRAITLDESQNGNQERIAALAEKVSSFLNCPIER